MADTYDIVTQADTTTVGPTGSVVQAMAVTFKSKPSGITSKVVIPFATYTPDEVAKAVAAAVDVIEAVQHL